MIKYHVAWDGDAPESILQLLAYAKTAESISDGSISFDNIYARYFDAESFENIEIGYFVNHKCCSGSSCENDIKFKRELVLARFKHMPYKTHLLMNPEYEGSLADIVGYKHERINHKLVKLETATVKKMIEEAIQDGFLSVLVS